MGCLDLFVAVDRFGSIFDVSRYSALLDICKYLTPVSTSLFSLFGEELFLMISVFHVLLRKSLSTPNT